MIRFSLRLSAGLLLAFVAGCVGSDGTGGWRQSAEPEADADFHPHHRGRDAANLPEAAGAADAGSAVQVADALGDADPDADGTDLGLAPSAPVTVVVLPDTQYYSSSHPEIFADQTRWIVEQKSIRNIAAVLHEGDVVDGASDKAQWTVANSAMRALDGVVPYVLVPGNHDSDANRVGLIDSYFAPATMPWITGIMTAGQIENNYAVVDIGPQQWLVLGLEFGPRDAVLTWADGVLKNYPTLPAIIVTHAYLYGDGTRYNYADYGSSQGYYPRFYNFTPAEGINDGQDIWQKLILPNANVRLVFSGHDNGAARLTSLRANGSPVHQMLADYQWLYDGTADARGGSGYLRVLEFDYGKKEIRVQTYSPYLDKSMTDDANQFTVSLEI